MAPEHGKTLSILRELHPCSHQGCSQVQGGRAGWAARTICQLAVQQPSGMAQALSADGPHACLCSCRCSGIESEHRGFMERVWL